MRAPCWMICQQVFSALLHLLSLGSWVDPWVIFYLSLLCRMIFSSLTCKPILATWYGLSYLVCGGHPSWPLEVTGNSGFFKILHHENFVAVISSSNHASRACRNAVFFPFSRVDWAKPTQIVLMAQSLDASVSSLIFFLTFFKVSCCCRGMLLSPSAWLYLILLARTAS